MGVHPFQTGISGFSLIEVVLVIAIVAVIAAIAAPRYTDALARYRADTTARRIAADVALVQARARSTSTSQTISFNASGNSYQLSGERDLNSRTAAYSVNLAGDPYYASINKLTIGANSAIVGSMSITFNGYGMPSNAAMVMIKSGSYMRKITIDADSGATTVK